MAILAKYWLLRLEKYFI